jgi:ABC-2 type transport system ATP-binding protein
MPMDSVIQIERLSKSYGARPALKELDLTVNSGEIFGFLGPNGAGKSTAIRLMLDLIRPSSGRASILGFDCQHQSHLARTHIGYLPGELRLYEKRTGHEIVRMIAGLRGASNPPPHALELADALEVDLSLRLGTLSKGNRQKVGLLLAMMSQPAVLLLDEPTSGLDPIMQQVVWALLRAEAERGVTVFFSSHVMGEVEEICERVAMLRDGELIAVESIDEMKGRAARQIEITFASAVPADAFRLPGVRELSRRHNSVTLEVTSAVDAVIKEAARYPVIDLRTDQPSLEDTLLTYYRGEAS